jgi:hypothetical protein
MLDLPVGADFREPKYRREVFLRFYEFHLKYRSHPGCVYYLMPWLAAQGEWDMEKKLWFAFLNGNTQNPVTSYIIFTQFPALPLDDFAHFEEWFHSPEIYSRLAWDTDRRYHRKSFIDACAHYIKLVASVGCQYDYFMGLFGDDEYENFRAAWKVVRDKFYTFGRLSAFSYLEYLRIMGLPLNCDQLFLDDMKGSMSHRNGLCKVLGRDDLDWHKSNPSFDGRYSPELLALLEATGAELLAEARHRAVNTEWARDTNYFTLESALCTYKSWHRPNRRYPNVYNDMLFSRINSAQGRWPHEPLDTFWEARRTLLPANLRLEDNPKDVGVHPFKQNHYLQTGEVIMMERDWDCFANGYSSHFIRQN